MCIIAGSMIGMLILGWNDFTIPTRMMMILSIMLALHVLEENILPGGFFFMYNKLKGSGMDLVDCYPMSPLIDSLTNVSGEIFFIIFLLHGMTNSLVVTIFAFCIGESIAHAAGIKKNKKWYGTIYNPGLFTTVFCFIPLGIYALGYIITHNFSIMDWACGIVIMIVMVVFSIVGMEKVLKNKETPYHYLQNATYGFYNQYIEKDTE